MHATLVLWPLNHLLELSQCDSHRYFGDPRDLWVTQVITALLLKDPMLGTRWCFIGQVEFKQAETGKQ